MSGLETAGASRAFRASCIVPDWPAPPGVGALITTRCGGVSAGAYASWNLGDHVGDDPSCVAENRRRLGELLPRQPQWLQQVHGTRVIDLDREDGREGDAAVARAPGMVCAVLTADCLPVLLCDRAGCVVGAVHAGWRGLAAGVLERACAAMKVPAAELLAWLGPAIGQDAFEVGDEVRAAFLAFDAQAARAFRPGRPGKWHADLYLLARQRLARLGAESVHGGGCCTFSEAQRFYSFRRDGVTGRMASLVWIAPG